MVPNAPTAASVGLWQAPAQLAAVLAIALAVWWLGSGSAGLRAAATYRWRSRGRIAAGEATWEDLLTVLTLPRVRRACVAQIGLDRLDLWGFMLHHRADPNYTPQTLIAWFRIRRDLPLLLAAMEAGVTDGELAAHLTGERPLDEEHLWLLVALRR